MAQGVIMKGLQHQYIRMKQAEQIPWLNKYAEGQLRVTRFAVRAFASLVDWLNTEHITNLVSAFVTRILDPALAALTGSYVNVEGKNVPVTFINNVDPTFQVPDIQVTSKNTKGKAPLYEPKQFPFEPADYDGNGLHEWVAHFLCLAIKVSYEQPSVVEHVVTRCWNWKFVKYFNTQPEVKGQQLQTIVHKERKAREGDQQRSNVHAKTESQENYSAKVAAKLIPDTNAFLMTNDQAVVLFFRGTEPSKLIEWASDGDIDLCFEEGVIHGQVHAGWYEALLYPLLDPKQSIFQEICQALVEALEGNSKKLYITGHSMGGALTSVCAHVLASLSEEARKEEPAFPEATVDIKVAGVESLYRRIGAIYTFAGPLAGDRGFAEFMQEMYGGNRPPKMFRISHSSDIVPKVPPTILGYRHHPLEYFLSFDGFMYNEPQDIELWKFVELAIFSRLYWAKLCYDWGVYSPDGENVLGQSQSWVQFRRRAWHAFLRIFFYTGGFGVLILFSGILCYVPDHFPCDYEQKLRVMARELRTYKQTPEVARPHLTTHLMSRTHADDSNDAGPIGRQGPLSGAGYKRREE